MKKTLLYTVALLAAVFITTACSKDEPPRDFSYYRIDGGDKVILAWGGILSLTPEDGDVYSIALSPWLSANDLYEYAKDKYNLILAEEPAYFIFSVPPAFMGQTIDLAVDAEDFVRVHLDSQPCVITGGTLKTVRKGSANDFVIDFRLELDDGPIVTGHFIGALTEVPEFLD
jgi:hypothetical protein